MVYECNNKLYRAECELWCAIDLNLALNLALQNNRTYEMQITLIVTLNHFNREIYMISNYCHLY